MLCMVAAWSFTCRDKNLQVSKRKHWEHPIRQVDEGKPISCRCSSTCLYKSQINWIHKPENSKEPNPGTSSLRSYQTTSPWAQIAHHSTNFPHPKTPFPKRQTSTSGQSDMGLSALPCSAARSPVATPMLMAVSLERTRRAVFWEGGNRKQHPSPVAGWETNNWVKLRRRSVSRPKWKQRGWNVFSFHYSLWCITTRLFCGPQVWLESSWALVSAKLQSCHPWASKLSCLPAVRVEVGHCVYVPFEDDKSLPNIQWWLMTLFWKILSISAFLYTN